MTEQRLPTQRWKHDGKTYSVAFYVRGRVVVGMTPVKVVVPKGRRRCNHKVSVQEPSHG